MQNNESKILNSKIIQLEPSLCKLKIGKELFTAAGPQLVEKLVAKNFDIFLDLKFHDIPNTVAKACQAASNLGVWMLNVHASGGSAMMRAAAEGVDIGSQGNVNKPLLIAVTVLTSSNQATLSEIGIASSIENQVLKLAKLTQFAGLHGVVCSALEAQLLKQHLPNDFLLVAPGIRPASASLDDQSRVLTPSQAMQMGANYLVIGRPITQASNPVEALIAINKEINTL
jgi:orotidine-5'-phosphate decarboxylase